MRKQIAFLILVVGVLLFSCDEPQPLGDSTFSYNPFSFTRDTLQNIQTITAGKADVQWGDHFRAWIGETSYHKSGISLEFVFPDTSLDLSSADSIKLQVRHAQSFNEIGQDTLEKRFHRFGFYETTDQTIDLNASVYGTLLGVDSVDVKTNNLYWSYILPQGTVASTDTSIDLGVFPEEAGVFSSVYGGGSTIRPALLFYFHEPDSAGEDSVTAITVQADTLHAFLEEKSTAFDRTKYHYLSQLRADSLVLDLDLTDLLLEGDTLSHVIHANLMLGIDHGASAYYVSGTEDSLTTFYIRVLDYDAELYSSLTLTEGDAIYDNISPIIQSAINDGRQNIQLVLRANHTGYDPGFMAIDRSLAANSLYVHTSRVVRP